MACAIGFAELGFEVTGYDVRADKIAQLRAGLTLYREQDIEKRLSAHLRSGAVRFENCLRTAASGASVILVTVGTPSCDDGSADLSAIDVALSRISELDDISGTAVVLRSTVPPGTSDDLAGRFHSLRLLYAPEFLREGTAVQDFLHPDRIVVGAATTEEALPYVRLFERMSCPILVTSRCNAELIKACSNAFLALKISFANEVANLCDAVGGTVDDVLRGVGYDRRIGHSYFNPGIGFGGPCLEKDLKSIRNVAIAHGSGKETFSAALQVNDSQPTRLVDRLEQALGGLKGAHIGAWGLSFKAGTNDERGSRALRVIREIVERGATVSAYDPAIRVTALPERCRLASSALEAAKADALVVLTDWPEFRLVPPSHLAARLRRRLVIDGRNILDGRSLAAAGLEYRGVGRPCETLVQEQPQSVAIIAETNVAAEPAMVL